MPNLPISILRMSARERREVLARLAAHLESAAEQASRDGDEHGCAELEELAHILFLDMNEIANDPNDSATDIVVQAVRMLSRAYEGRDPGWFMLH